MNFSIAPSEENSDHKETIEAELTADGTVESGVWMATAATIRLRPDEDQRERDGFRYGITLYEDQREKLSFTPTSIGGIYYLHDETFELRSASP